MDKLTFLLSQNVDLLICGTISRSLQLAIEEHGINAYLFCSGEVSELIECWQKDQLDQVPFAMPGCDKRWRMGLRSQGNGPRTGRSMGLSRGEEQTRMNDDESCKRIRRRQRMRNVGEEGPNCNRRGNAEAGNGRGAGQGVQSSQAGGIW
ncbi:dinitrogenase iron-molybdenum cofactor [Vibrio sp. ES.051]|uniref:NifB/NifX family molybdenum-iron cluster-binding protein n=1 Tax=Vibrio sp. ES.051 TaxID=1761909 RepID=UPI000BF6DA58|nr:NifB/NifX family molybdenum-iron cluster-binding protein [Vibrio sp. ES.051]PFG58016.1 dinitrogenase iron-molybdenum cofactor [Vibrio sp. ES.051]